MKFMHFATVSGISVHRRNFLILTAVMTFTLSMVRLGMELLQFISCYEKKETRRRGHSSKLSPKINWKYFQDWSNWLEVPLFTLSPIFVVVPNTCLCPSPWQWQLGAVVLFLAWINLLTFLYKLPAFGLYLLMMEQIIRKFLRVMIIAFLFSLAFGFAFYMAFYEPDILVSFCRCRMKSIQSCLSLCLCHTGITICKSWFGYHCNFLYDCWWSG